VILPDIERFGDDHCPLRGGQLPAGQIPRPHKFGERCLVLVVEATERCRHARAVAVAAVEDGASGAANEPFIDQALCEAVAEVPALPGNRAIKEAGEGATGSPRRHFRSSRNWALVAVTEAAHLDGAE
jgi:hypothetical protein